ncbi:hybrid sensor histidine kinase/response regulator [Azomonas agilis]|uniref:hybrid sensor histidine kinase/response regulator n=1 Tax=Azomonas agilis TaxID=116849 RepID=UPI0011A33F93|nr:NahK/ErcS family hybrid sensor histidine kinase/response regulator [Azomonas agilis]
MGCISTKPSPALPSADRVVTPDAELKARFEQLERENYRLKRINAALIERVESRSAPPDDAYTAFQYSVELAEQVRERTDALNQAMAELKSSNRLLSEARQRAETAHRYLIDAIESISDAFVLFDQDQRIVLFNSRFKAFWEISQTRVTTGMLLADIKRLAGSTGLIVEEHRGNSSEQSFYRLFDGRWVQVHERRTRGGGLVILYTDITEVKNRESIRREQALAQKSTLLQRAIDNLSQGVAMVASDGCLELWNRRFLELSGLTLVMTGRPFAEVMAKSELPLLTPESRDQNERSISHLEQHLPDGRVLEIRTHPLPSGGFVNTFTDITERHRHAEKLRESEHWVRMITDHVPALIAYLSADLVYQFTNRVYEDWYHWTPGLMLGCTLFEAHTKAHCRQLQPYLDRALQGENVSFELSETNLNGQKRCLLRSYVPNQDSEGRIVGIFILVRDITERRRTSEALQRAYQNLEQRVRDRTTELTALNSQLREEIEERTEVEARLREAKREAELANLSKTKFLAAVSHDLLQPLNAARLFTSALLEARDSSNSSSLIRNLSNSLEDVEHLLSTLVDISKLDAGAIQPELSVFAINELLDNLAVEFTQLAQSQHLQMRFVSSSVLVHSDVHLLARILRNLLTNALRYTPSPGRILLGCRRTQQHLWVEVWDTGIGIPQDKLQEIFQEFKRGEHQHRNQDRGLGLGLAIVDKISRMLGHEVQVQSVLGKGSVFRVRIPIAQQRPSPRFGVELPAPITDKLHGAHVWVVDNDTAICAGMRTLLEGWGCAVVTALSAEDLAERTQGFQAPADLLIVDYHLDQGRTGLEAVAQVNTERKTPLPALMITANYTNELKQQIRDLNHVLLHKPVRPMKLKTAMSHLLERV